jgi:uncharacterized protein (DUF1501 family)
MTNRRAFVKSGAMAIFASGLSGFIPSFVARAAKAQKNKTKDKTLLCIFQRGAMDGLMAVSPYADAYLKTARPLLYMSPASTEGQLIPLNERFGLHPALSSLAPFFNNKTMAIVHGVGSPNNTRSHFDAQDYMESGTPFNKGTSNGWLNRALSLANQSNSQSANPFQAVSITNAIPRSLYGEQTILSVNNLQDLAIQSKGNALTTNFAAKSLEELYDETANDLLNKTGKESFDALKLLRLKELKNYQPADGVVYPTSPLGNSLKQIAFLIKMKVGLEIAFAESGGWDTHFNQGTTNGLFSRNLKDFSDCIAAFWKDIAAYQHEVTVMTMTEFGRTVRQNGTGGTDHGRASCMFVLGNDVMGGTVYNNLPILNKDNLEDGRDLPVTTDFRSVFSAVANHHLNLQTNNTVLFPGWNGAELSLMKTIL